MDSFNSVSLVGFLELDLTTRWHGESTQVTSFTLRLEEHTAAKTHRVYVPVIAYGKTAEQAADLAPGDLLGVQGKLVYRRAPDRHSEQSGRLLVMAHSIGCLVPAPVAVT
jgi:single-stranded DNA-binding protein